MGSSTSPGGTGAFSAPSMAAMYGAPFPQAFGSPYMHQSMPNGNMQFGMPGGMPGVGATLGSASPAAMAALGLVDESFREQIQLLRKAAARHRGLLEKSQMHAPAAASSMAVDLQAVPET